MGFEQDFKQLVREASEKVCKNATELAEKAGVSQAALSQLLSGKRKGLQLESVGKLLDAIGVSLTRPWEREQTREVCLVDAKIVRAGEHGPPIIPEEYVAVPLVSEAGAGPGIVPQDEFKSWVLVYRNLRSIARRSNLIAVEIGKNSRSMVPLLHPGDLVLVDLDDRGELSGFAPPGNTYLVREPGQEGGGKIKRVSMSGQGKNATIIYYSENVAENVPESYFLAQDFDNDITKAIVGKVVWAWTDLSRK